MREGTLNMRTFPEKMNNDKYKLKIAAISGASRALDYMDKNPKATKEEIIQHVTDRSDEIVDNIEDEI